jgi:putative membrane protein insertion efficiency factor
MNEFYYDHLPSKEDVVQELIKEKNKDNIEIDYNRQLIRPKLRFLDFLIIFLLPFFGILVFLSLILLSKSIVVAIIFILVLFISTCKVYILKLIRFYQAYAPANIRMKCRFTPSCSEYTYIVISRFGFFKGIYKGIKRIKRCNPENGGIDNPET